MSTDASGEELVRWDDNSIMEMFTQSRTWMGGNMFLGPRNRGPFSTSFGRTEKEMLEAFEQDVTPIIGSEQMEKLFYVFQNLLKFHRRSSQANADLEITEWLGFVFHYVVYVRSI